MRNIYYVLSIIALLIVVFTVYDYNSYREQRLINAHSIGQSTTHETKEHLDSIFFLINASADELSVKLAANNYSEAEIKDIIKSEVNRMSFLLGITVAYEPFSFDPNKKLYSLFFDQRKSAFLKIENKYDYQDTSLTTAKWYTQVAITQKPYLTEPYFGEVAEELVDDYSVPIIGKDKVGNKKLLGVLTYSISLDQFTETVDSFIQGNSGYAFLINSEGLIITHPNRSYILNKSITDILNHPKNLKSTNRELEKDKGQFEYTSSYTGISSTLFFQTTELTKWKIAVIYSTTDLMGNPKKLEQKFINIAMSVSFLVLFVLIIILRIYKGDPHKLWQLSAIISLLFVLNIVVIWIIQLDIDYSEELKNRTRVYSRDALNSYVSKKNLEQKLLGKSEYLEVPTGIFVEELLVSDSYNMSVSGKIWQKWPIDHDLKDNRGFHFLQASPLGRSVIVELLSKDKLDSATWLYTWKFNSTLRIFFDYNQYPLDQHYIDIKLIYPDMTDKIMLVPDFASYEVLNPSSKPGMSDIIFLPKHRIIASYFSFSSLDLKTFFGQNRDNTSSEYGALEYNIVIKRRFITPFVSFVIPFIIGASIIFFLLYSLNKEKDDTSGVTVMGVVQGMAGLFFAMLLAHITIRNKIPTPHVTYLESFYFIIYIMIILLIMIVVMYSRSTKYKLLNYQDNLITKVLYWPFLFGLTYIITLIKFY